MWSGQLVIPGVSTLPCVTLMSSLKTIILKLYPRLRVPRFSLLCAPWQKTRPNSKRRPFTSFCFVRFFKCFICSCILSLAVSESTRREPSCSPFAGVYAAVRCSPIPRFAGVYAAVRGSPIPRFAGLHAAVRGSAIPPFVGVDAAVRGSAIPPFAGVHAAVRGSTSPKFTGDDATIHG